MYEEAFHSETGGYDRVAAEVAEDVAAGAGGSYRYQSCSDLSDRGAGFHAVDRAARAARGGAALRSLRYVRGRQHPPARTGVTDEHRGGRHGLRRSVACDTARTA